MESKFFIKDSKDFIAKKVELKGWVYNKRSSGSIAFLQLRDGTGFIQGVVVKNEVSPTTFETARNLTLESSVIITGLIREDKRAPSGYEMSIVNIKTLQIPKEEYPLGKKDHGPDFLLNNRHLWLRSKRQWAIQRVRHAIIYAIYSHLEEEGFIKIDAPILTPSAAEGTTTLFPVPYLPAWSDEELDKEEITLKSQNAVAYLSQSGQLYLEAAIAAHGKVFDFGPTFRAEKSKTRRHLSEFWMMDAEAAFVEHEENMATQEKLIKAILKAVLDKCPEELNILERDTTILKNILDKKFPIINHQEAIKLAQKENLSIGQRDDLGAEAETLISNKFDTPVFIQKYPKEIKAFYMKADPKDSSRVLNNDLLAPEGFGEIIGGSQREDNLEKLTAWMKELNMNLKDYEWYLDLRRFGSIPHSGFGAGLERLVAWICKLEHVRESIPFPRMLDRFTP
ncbi:asparagine--tRNA ligase [Candidatus Gottesmanbacteria bacterium]|nr:asparagine--tRNA ligase [Candidatus Gottesmanbacteria bacterium]